VSDEPSAAPLIVVVAVLGLIGAILAAFVGIVPSLGVFDQGRGEGVVPGLNLIVNGPAAPADDAAAPADRGTDPQVELSAAVGSAGDRITVSGSGFRPDETVVIRIDTDEVARTRADGAGGFSGVDITIPAQLRALAPERLLVIATGQKSVRSGSTQFLVSK
jgi:hypothetical protein